MSSQVEIYEDEDPQQAQPVDAGDDDPDAVYAGVAARLDTESLMLMVAERLSTSNALRAIVEDTKRAPFTSHDRRRFHPYEAMRLGDAVAELLVDAMDELVEMTVIGEGR